MLFVKVLLHQAAELHVICGISIISILDSVG